MSEFFKGWRRKVAGLALLMAILLLFIPFRNKAYFKCAICHANRHETSFLWLHARATHQETQCSDWYAQNVESHHEHVWVRNTFAQASNAYGMTYSSNLMERSGGPVVRFGSGEALMLYQHAPEYKQARVAFLRLATWERESTPAHDQQRQIETKLARWLESGFAGGWPLEDESPPHPMTNSN